jgi:transposase
MTHGRSHSREFKLDVVRQIARGEQRPAQICREYGLAEGLLLRWRKEYDARGEAAFGPSEEGGNRELAQRVAECQFAARSGSPSLAMTPGSRRTENA